MVFVAIILVMVYILPESPRWLLAHKREDEAKLVLSMLNDHGIHDEFEEIQTSIQAEQAAQVSWSQMFEGGLGTRRVLLGMMLQLVRCPLSKDGFHNTNTSKAQQLSGVNALGYFLPYVIHKSVGLSETVARWVAAATGVGIGGALPSSNWPGIVSVVFIWLYFTAFSSGWISIPWLYAAEVNGLSMRGKAASLGKCLQSHR